MDLLHSFFIAGNKKTHTSVSLMFVNILISFFLSSFACSCCENSSQTFFHSSLPILVSFELTVPRSSSSPSSSLRINIFLCEFFFFLKLPSKQNDKKQFTHEDKDSKIPLATLNFPSHLSFLLLLL